MKKSKFINDVRHHVADVKEAEAIAALAEQAGAKFDPEEPELPERVTLAAEGPGASVRTEEGERWIDLSLVDEVSPLLDKEVNRFKELLACYNFVRRVELIDKTADRVALHELLRWLEQEREKLL